MTASDSDWLTGFFHKLEDIPPFQYSPDHQPRARDGAELLKIAEKHARELFSKHRAIPGTIFLHDNDPGSFTSVLHVKWKNTEQKYRAGYAFQKTMTILDLPRFAVINECWYVEGSKGDEKELIRVQPSKHPGRKECVIVAVHDKESYTRAKFYEIVRPPFGKPKLVTRHDKTKMTEFIDNVFSFVDVSGRPN